MFGACDAIPGQAKMPPASQPLFQEGVHLGWQGWGRCLAGGDVQPHAATETAASRGKHKTPELVAVCHPPMLTSRAAERTKSMTRECILQHMQPPFFFFSFCWNSSVPLPLALPHFLLSAEFFLFLHVQYGLSLGFHSVLQAIF